MENRKDPRDMNAAVLAEQIRILYKNQPITLLGSVVVSLVATYSVIDTVDVDLAVAWLIAVLVITVVRAVNYAWFNKSAPADTEINGWRDRAVLLAFVSGALWAALPIMFVTDATPFIFINVVVLSAGMLSGSLASQSVHLPTLCAFSIPLAIGLCGAVHVNGGEFSHFAWLGYIFCGALLGFARGHNRMYRQSIETRFENDRLIVELRQKKAEAEAANIAKSKFLAAASHDLRQPLHAVGLYAGALRDAATTDQQAELNGKMSRAIDSLEQLLGHILEVSKLDAGVVEPIIVDFRVGELLERLDLRYGAIAKAQGLEYESSGHELLVRSDRVLLERILDNLLTNALRFTEQGRVALDVSVTDSKLQFEITDTGIGIPVDEHDAIFDEFYQLGNPERDRSKGLGLGLSIVRRLCGLLGHELSLVSKPGGGSRFTLVTDLGEADGLAVSDVDTAYIEQRLDERRVLVIDDEQEVRDATFEQLQSWGCLVSTADSLQQACELTGDQVPELLIVDYRLRNHESGIDAVLEYRRRFGEEIPAVLVTGDTAPERIREAVDSGIQVLHKPVTPAKLRMCVSQLTSRSTRGGDTSPARTAM
ncbi:MAG: ATP-binding response regulator [Woeseiaceae bacterium]